MPTLVGRRAPEFEAKAVVDGRIVDNFSLKSYRGQNVLFFFYPLDFTFVCPTELHAFQDHIEEFERRNTVVVGCSVDSVHAHFAWLHTSKHQGGIQGIEYPLVSDLNKTISQAYGVLVPEEGIAFRGLYLIDKLGIVRHQLINDLPLGRSVDEALRIIDALNYYELNGEVCPANWKTGKKTLQASTEGVRQYFALVDTV
ncbi:MAG: peroxiredoxin [Chlamydiales bacterium]|nr:peroxiredoxin [Chlamydiales bacterium]